MDTNHIQEMNVTIKHRAGKKNTNADALSKNSTEAHTSMSSLVIANSDNLMVQEYMVTCWILRSRIRKEQQNVPNLLPVVGEW